MTVLAMNFNNLTYKGWATVSYNTTVWFSRVDHKHEKRKKKYRALKYNPPVRSDHIR